LHNVPVPFGDTRVLTNAGALDRDKQLAVVRQLTDLISTAGS